MTDRFGNDEYHIERIEDRYDFKPFAQPHEGGTFIADLLKRPGHVCSRICPEHGDLKAVSHE